MRFLAALCFSCCFLFYSAGAQSGRTEAVLSGDGWHLWLDRGATWYNDEIHLPPVDVAGLPVNPPTCGWDSLHSGAGLSVHVPGTVEEHYWGQIGGAVPDTGGNYVGVSWWSRKFSVDPKLKGKRFTLCFQSANLRAEVFVNGKLVGYDVVGNAPFEADASAAVVFDKENQLDIRITDPVGNFEWNDNILMRWGKNLVPAVHGFGGITGEVVLRATDAVNVEDIYVQNQPDPQKLNLFIALQNHSGAGQSGNLTVVLHEKGDTSKAVWSKTVPVNNLGDTQTIRLAANVPAAKRWMLTAADDPKKQTNEYEASVRFTSRDGSISDRQSQRFGFRWFDVVDKNNDPTFYLNGKRVFVLAAMTRGMWPKNGMFPTPEMARRDMEALCSFGLNTMLMHRAIGQPLVIEYADSAGLFTYEEPGGYRIMPNKKDDIAAADDQSRAWRKEKLRRMVIRDRSFPSLIMYNLKNEETVAPDRYDEEDMKMVHLLDPSRILTYNSGSEIGSDYHKKIPNNPFKLHMLPYNQQFLYDGWWDQHHWVGQSGYVDENYRNPRFYLRGVDNSPRTTPLSDSLDRLNPREILFFGEEGAFGAIVRLQKIKEELDSTDKNATGYREQEHLDWFHAYDKFLDETGFRSAYPDVDSLTRSLGRNLHYFHARNIENVRLSNSADAYNMNGWASESTRTDVVDTYRNPTADASIIHAYTRPLYVAVKLRHKVVPAGYAPIADFYAINEKDLKGKGTLLITLTDPSGASVFSQSVPVTLKGGDVFGQLMKENLQLPALTKPGYYHLNAILNGMRLPADGTDEVFVVDPGAGSPLPSELQLIESDKSLSTFFSRQPGVKITAEGSESNAAATIVVGNIAASELTEAKRSSLLGKVAAGATLLVLEHADLFAESLNAALKGRPAIYNGGGIIHWGGSGRLFIGHNAYLQGLPQGQGMSWEYQCFYKTPDSAGNAMVSGLALTNWQGNLVVALGNQGKKEILSALTVVPFGKGKVVLSTLSLLPNLSSGDPTAVVAQRLFANLLTVKP